MARKKTTRNTTKRQSNAREAKAAVRAAIAQIKADRRVRQHREKAALKAQHKAERIAEQKRIKAFRHAGSVLKKAGAAGFSGVDFRKAVPSLSLRKKGVQKTGLEKAIARLHDVVIGESKLVKVPKSTKEKLKSEGFITSGNKVQVLKEQVVTKKGEVKYRTLASGSIKIPVDDLDSQIRLYFDKHEGKRVGVQLGDGGSILYVIFDDPDSLIDYLETNFSSALTKEAFNEIVLIPADKVDAARQRLAKRRRAEMRKRPTMPKQVSESRKEARRARNRAAAKRYRARHGKRL